MAGAYEVNHKSNDKFLVSLNWKAKRLVLFYGLMATGNPKTSQLHKFFFRLKNTNFPCFYQKSTRSQRKKSPEASKKKQQIIPEEPSEKVKWEFFRTENDTLPLENYRQLPDRQELPYTHFLPGRRIIKRIGNHSFKPKTVHLKDHIIGLSPLMVNYRPPINLLLF